MSKILIKHLLLSLLLLVVSLNSMQAVARAKIRLGVLAFGTVNWELQALKNNQLLEAQPFQLEIKTLTSPQAGKIALQSDAVDIIISDWIWVSRQRSAGINISFYPYSSTAGALMVGPESPIHKLADLSDKTLGIAGGELDKNWLLLQALAQHEDNLDLNEQLTRQFAAPPLLNQQLLQGRIDAMINYWHYAARLEAQGYRQLLDGNDIQKRLGIKPPVPTLGYVFNRNWAEKNKELLNSFLKLTQTGKNFICEKESVWKQIIPLTKATNPNTQALLRSRYCQGRVASWNLTQQQQAETIYQILKQTSGNRLTGKADHIQAGTFWSLK